MQNKKEQREQMMLMITDWQASGLKQREYCATNNIAYHVFHYWYSVYRANKTDTGSFLPVKVSSAASKEQISIVGVNGIQVQIPLTEQSIVFVKRLLQA
ncbi:MAG: hypothetical protein Q8L07_10440 [Sediminibacterium sp.]|nr:hypothetical protein [Sediminibacterium sp.]MDP3666168.1 hypothetical protein [Sediminibacterium sp.]